MNSRPFSEILLGFDWNEDFWQSCWASFVPMTYRLHFHINILRTTIAYNYYLQVIQYINLMQDDNSDLFNVEPSKDREPHTFNLNTQIIKEGQRHKVVFGQMQLEKKTLHQIVTPYLYQFATTTAEIAAKAGTTTFEALKNGFLWVYNKFVDNVIPYAVENLPKIIFVSKKEENVEKALSASIEIMVNENDYNQISTKEKSQNPKDLKTVVVPMGTENDKHFQEYLRNEKYEIRYSYPIDVSSDEINIKESFMIPSESFEMIVEDVKQSHLQLQIQQPSTYKKVAFKLDKCFIFEFQGQNTIEYDLLDSIEKADDVKVGYIVDPEQALRRSVSDKEDPISDLINGREKKVEIAEEKEVDMTRNVLVDTTGRKQKPGFEFALN